MVYRSDIVMLKAAKAITALHGRSIVEEKDIEEAAELVLLTVSDGDL